MPKVKRSAPAPAPAVTASAASAPKVKRSAPAVTEAPKPDTTPAAKGAVARVSVRPTKQKVKRSAPAPAITTSLASARNVTRLAPAATEATKPDSTPATNGAVAAAIVIEIPSSPENSDGSRSKKARKRPALIEIDDEIEMWTPRQKWRFDDDCQILAGDPLSAAKVSPAAAENDDVTVVAERGKVACRDYPHPRSACARNPFNTTSHEQHCDKCFCYVCDIAAPCMSWKGTAGGHCHASDKDQNWKAMRVSRQKAIQLSKQK